MKIAKILSVALVGGLLVSQTACGSKNDENKDGMNDSETTLSDKDNDAYESEGMEEETVKVGGADMYPSKNIIENASNSEDHTTLVAAVKAAGLVETLQGTGPFTVFAPTNKAFDKLPEGTVENLLLPANKAKLTGILTYHVVAGKLDSDQLKALIEAGDGKAELKTVQGGKLWASKKLNKIILTDEKGETAAIDIDDVYQSNGVIHVVDAVLMHK